MAGREWSYRELARPGVMTQHLIEIGVYSGARVLLFAEKEPEWTAAVLAVLRAGAVVVPVDIQFNDEDLAHVLSDSSVGMVITT